MMTQADISEKNRITRQFLINIELGLNPNAPISQREKAILEILKESILEQDWIDVDIHEVSLSGLLTLEKTGEAIVCFTEDNPDVYRLVSKKLAAWQKFYGYTLLPDKTGLYQFIDPDGIKFDFSIYRNQAFEIRGIRTDSEYPAHKIYTLSTLPLGQWVYLSGQIS